MILQVARPLAEREQSLAALRNTLITGDAVVLAVASVIGWVLSGYTLRPIKRITQTAQQIGNEQDFSRRVDYHGPNDEVGQLAKTFNTMLGQLEDSYQKVSGALEMQRDFLADVSHELRTPLTFIRGYVDLLLEGSLGELSPAQLDALKIVSSKTEALTHLVNDIISLQRAEMASLDLAPVSLGDVIELACAGRKRRHKKRT